MHITVTLFVCWDLWLLIRISKRNEQGQLQKAWLCCAPGLSLCSWTAARDLAPHAAVKGWCCSALSPVCLSSLSALASSLFASLVVNLGIRWLNHNTSSCFCPSPAPQNAAWAVPRLLAWAFVPACRQPCPALVPLCWTCTTFCHSPALKIELFLFLSKAAHVSSGGAGINTSSFSTQLSINTGASSECFKVWQIC